MTDAGERSDIDPSPAALGAQDSDPGATVIRLGQFLKLAGLVNSGGEAKLRATGDKLKLTTIPDAEWAEVENAALKFWDEIAAESPLKAKVVDIIRKYNKDYKLIFIGDATMSPYEILQPGGSVEYNNGEAGAVWLQRLTHAFPKLAWINPEQQGVWQYRQSISIIQQLTEESGMAVILVEQHARQILPLTRQALVLERGKGVYQGPSQPLLDDSALLDSWLGVSSH
mgnify:CR=1 FL=1